MKITTIFVIGCGIAGFAGGFAGYTAKAHEDARVIARMAIVVREAVALSDSLVMRNTLLEAAGRDASEPFTVGGKPIDMRTLSARRADALIRAAKK